jgi:hypothetical protein
MTIGNWLTVAAIIVAAIVPLVVAHLHRKQMRQIELHRADPSIPVVPPLNPITLFLKNWGILIFNVLFNIGVLINQLLKTGPITRGQVFLIALSLSSLAFILLLETMKQSDLKIYDHMINAFESIRDVSDTMSDVTGTMKSVVDLLPHLVTKPDEQEDVKRLPPKL